MAFREWRSPRPKTFDTEPEPRELAGMGDQSVAIVLGQIDDFWNEQRLRRDRPRIQPLAQGFEHQPFMRRMLIDDDEPVRRLGDDIVLMQLRAGGPQGMLRFRRCRLAHGCLETLDAGGRRRQRVESGLRTLREVVPRGHIEACRAVGRGGGIPVRGRPWRLGAEGAHQAGGARGRGPVAAHGQRLADRTDDQPAHKAGITEAHVDLAGCTLTSTSSGSSVSDSTATG